MAARQAAGVATGAPRLPTGIAGFDDILAGGLPVGRTTLLSGGLGTGKTVLALASLVHGARDRREPGLFVAFEEDGRRVMANAASFGWGLPELGRKRQLVFLDARLARTVVRGGPFDLQGLIAGMDALARRLGARRLVLDGVDALIGTLGDPVLERREITALHEWLSESGLTAILTVKTDDPEHASPLCDSFLPYFVDCVVLLRLFVENRMAYRRVRVVKYRGVQHSSNEFPLLISAAGLEVASYGPPVREYRASREKVSCGIPRLDTMLGGGIFRGSSVLVSGAPGAAKSTLGAAFVLAACRRRERALFVSLDESADQIVRNMASVGLNLAPHVASRMLRMYSIRPRADSADEHLGRICRVALEHRARALVVDPISALGGLTTTDSVEPARRLLEFAKSHDITLLTTSLLEERGFSEETAAAGISTIADTWIHLSYAIRGGERNRALTVIKSRGVGHSNQVRELVLSERGVTLADVYAAGGEVLMGTLRYEQEARERAEQVRRSGEMDLRRHQAELAIAESRARIAVVEHELGVREAELKRLAREETGRLETESLVRSAVHVMRRADREGPDGRGGPAGARPRRAGRRP